MDGFKIDKIDSFSCFVEDIDYNMFYILRCNKGSVSFSVNSKGFDLTTNNNVIIVSAQHILVNKESDDLELVVYAISYSYFDELTVLFDDQFFKVLWCYTPNMLSEAQMAMSNSFLDQIYTICTAGEYVYKKVIISNIIQCYMLDIFEHVHLNVIDELISNTNHRKTIMSKFYRYIIEHKVRDVEFYAKLMNLSSRNLYNITQASLRVTPKNIIDSTMLAIIKNMLLVSGFNNQQIAEMLNFSDQSAFCQYFKRCEGISPSAYRKINKV